MARWHSRSICSNSWLTISTVPVREKSSMKRRERSWNAPSPTDSASSTMRMSAAAWAQIAKERRATMPEEYILAGRSK